MSEDHCEQATAGYHQRTPSSGLTLAPLEGHGARHYATNLSESLPFVSINTSPLTRDPTHHSLGRHSLGRQQNKSPTPQYFTREPSSTPVRHRHTYNNLSFAGNRDIVTTGRIPSSRNTSPFQGSGSPMSTSPTVSPGMSRSSPEFGHQDFTTSPRPSLLTRTYERPTHRREGSGHSFRTSSSIRGASAGPQEDQPTPPQPIRNNRGFVGDSILPLRFVDGVASRYSLGDESAKALRGYTLVSSHSNPSDIFLTVITKLGSFNKELSVADLGTRVESHGLLLHISEKLAAQEKLLGLVPDIKGKMESLDGRITKAPLTLDRAIKVRGETAVYGSLTDDYIQVCIRQKIQEATYDINCTDPRRLKKSFMVCL